MNKILLASFERSGMPQDIHARAGFVLRQFRNRKLPKMHMDAILRITAIVQVNMDAKLATDKFKIADDVQAEFPDIARETLIDLAERAIATIGGAAV